MAVDTATYISQFDTAKPAGTDPKSEGDDNLRHIKTVIKTCFPNINAAMTATSAELNATEGRLDTLETDLDALEAGTVPTALAQAIFDIVYPVGSVYFTDHDVDLPTSMSTYGTWANLDASNTSFIMHHPSGIGNENGLFSAASGTNYWLRWVRGWVRTA